MPVSPPSRRFSIPVPSVTWMISELVPVWNCLEVGEGGGSIAKWLCERVTSTGHVLVTDIDTRFLEQLRLPNLEVRQHNIVTDPLPERAFDLVHARLVLAHVPERNMALRKLISVLRPGGWVLLEELADREINPPEKLLRTYTAMMKAHDRQWSGLALRQTNRRAPACREVSRRFVKRPSLHVDRAILWCRSAARRVYQHAIEQFIAWYCSEPRLAFNRIVVVRYRIFLEGRGLAANTINQQLAAVRRLAYEAADAGLLSPELAAGISRVKGVKQLGHRSGNWLSLDQSSQVLNHACGDSLRAKRDYAMLAMLLGCGLRRSELASLETDEVQTRQSHWAIVDLIGKGGHIRTVPIPQWTKQALDLWTSAAEITDGRIFRAVSKRGKVWGKGISQNVVWYVVRNCCKKAGLDHIAPHDLRRTCAKLCHAGGGELEQIQFLLGHASLQTTERYLGCKQNLRHPVNDRFTLRTVASIAA